MTSFLKTCAAFRESIVALDDIRRKYHNRSRKLADQLFYNCFRTIRSLKA